ERKAQLVVSARKVRVLGEQICQGGSRLGPLPLLGEGNTESKANLLGILRRRKGPSEERLCLGITSELGQSDPFRHHGLDDVRKLEPVLVSRREQGVILPEAVEYLESVPENLVGTGMCPKTASRKADELERALLSADPFLLRPHLKANLGQPVPGLEGSGP